jgi:hypothetical protein
MEGYLAMLIGQCVPYQSSFAPTAADRANWAKIQQAVRNKVATAFTVPQALALVRAPAWNWPSKLYDRTLASRP